MKKLTTSVFRMEESFLSLLKEEDTIVKELNTSCKIAEEWKKEHEKEFDNHHIKNYYDSHVVETIKLRAELSECRKKISNHIKMLSE